MKRNTGRMLLSFLFVLTLAVGLLPGIGTALAEGGHTITTPSGLQYGTVALSSAQNTFEKDDTVTVTVTPDAGCRLKSIRATYQSVEMVDDSLGSGDNPRVGKYFTVRAGKRTTSGWNLRKHRTIGWCDDEWNFSRMRTANPAGYLAGNQGICRQQATEIQPSACRSHCAVIP